MIPQDNKTERFLDIVKRDKKEIETYPVSVVGAGPGDPELITVKGQRLLQKADLVVYAGSLVNPDTLRYCRADAELIDSSGLALEEFMDRIVSAHKAGKRVVRLQTGDPSLYSAIAEQGAILNDEDIAFEMIPGVSSAFASAAAIKSGLTLAEVTQTVIFTRSAGRTPVPEAERLAKLASHGATICIFLSISMLDQVTRDLKGSYPGSSPVAVVYRASWPDELIIKSTLDKIAKEVKKAGIKKQAMIIISPALAEPDLEAAKSKLYDRGFSHGTRDGK